MSQLRNKTKKDRKLAGKWIVIAIFSYLIVVLTVDLVKVWRSRERLVDAKSQVEKLKAEQLELKQQLEIVESEAFVEQQIRDELMLAKEGETIVVIPFDLAQGKSGEEAGEDKAENLANWQKWA